MEIPKTGFLVTRLILSPYKTDAPLTLMGFICVGFNIGTVYVSRHKSLAFSERVSAKTFALRARCLSL